MKKEEFLNELEQRLDILNANEKLDIIAEYSQHIDLKIENGLSEEAAAGDFGNIKVLADEILSAYNVNLKYNRPKLGENLKHTFVKAWKAVIRFLKRIGILGIGVLKKCALAVSHTGRLSVEFCKRQFDKVHLYIANKTDRAKQKKNDKFELESNGEINIEQQCGMAADTEEGENEMAREQIPAIPRRTQEGLVKRAVCNIGDCIKRICLWCVRCLILFTALPFIASGLFALLMLGIIIILIPQGYPLLGIGIITFGFCMSTASITCILLSYYSKKKRKNTIDNAVITEEVQE